MKTSRWLPAALALSLTPGLALAQDRTADPTKSTDTAASHGSSAMPPTGDDKAGMKTSDDKADMKKSGDMADMKDADASSGAAAKGSKYTLWKLHQANQMEIQMSQLALTNATSRETKSFAQKMIADHKGADAKVTQAATKAGADLDAKPSAADKAEMDEAMTKMDQMKSTKGKDFDAQFATQMADDHKKAVELAATASRDPAQKDIKPLLTQLLPKLQQHQKMAMQLASGRAGMAGKAHARGAMKMDHDGDKDMDSDKGSDKDKDDDAAAAKKGPKDMDATNPR